ncbi:hypothetical protein [Gluconobacter albidus]|uniref:Uncharacterized protein n=1 Tax=Gluconobacter albidus TaxID=318683 RepID=A0AAW3R1Y8_9PROT|nr:hypothetical protein [Gluconobacter albidus]KXV41769.1 hypothetical protein AD941_02640 [Gluconobacter albidus]GBQ91279.1 hypothetical protein AA3250_2241 [Gluconobacter albidus NBRC 3250]GLQ68566.1 hypothetical protein GCM10007866_10170 [Gluconobacter albidus]
MAEKDIDLELKFDGVPVQRLHGAPAEAVIASLNALQRMVYIIGMSADGRVLSERLKPTVKVKREYAVVCRAPRKGSHIQPFTVASQAGEMSSSSFAAREKLLATLRAFDSGEDTRLKSVIPNARERWFLAKAATGLLPPEDSGLEIMIRAGTRGPFAFKADRARSLLRTYDTPRPPAIDEETVVGKLRAIDYQQTIMTIKPGSNPALRMDYPLQLESWLQTNVRKRLKISGRPKTNARGDISSFDEIYNIVELEPHLQSIDHFTSGGTVFWTNRPISLPVTVYWVDRLFGFTDSQLGIDVVVDNLSELRVGVMSELDLVWRQYAQADDDELDDEAVEVKRHLLSRFRSID